MSEGATMPNYEAAAKALSAGIFQGEINEVPEVQRKLARLAVDAALAGFLVVRREDAMEFEVMDGGAREGEFGQWVQAEPWIRSDKIEPARCLLPIGSYYVIPVERRDSD